MSDTPQVTVLIPTPLRRFTGGEARVNASGSTVASLLDDLEVQHPGLKERICESDGQIRRFVNIFINGENVRERDGAETPVNSGDEIGIIPAMAGGSSSLAA
jgi:MoaD family protein